MDFNNLGRVSRGLPQPTDDGSDADLRLGRYGDQYVKNLFATKHVLADEGSYYVATTPTPGTGIAEFSVSTAFSDTRGFIVIGNTDQPANPAAKRIYVDYIALMLNGTAPTATTILNFAIKRSQINREATTAANRTLLAPVNMATASGRTPISRITTWSAAAAMTVPASNPTDPVISRMQIPTSLGIAGDVYVLKFGGEDMAPTPGLTAVRAAAPARLVVNAPPWVIEPGEFHVLHRWWLTEATNGPTFELEMGFWER